MSIKLLIDTFSKKACELEDYVKTQNSFCNKNFSPQKSRQMGNVLDGLAKKIINIDIEEFVKLLDNSNIVVAKTAAEYLFPLYPRRCIVILERYHSMLSEKLDMLKLELEINGLKSSGKFLVDRFEKLYGVKDISVLNRENQ